MPQSILDSHMKNVKDLAEKGTENLETAGLEKSGKLLFFSILEYAVIVANRNAWDWVWRYNYPVGTRHGMLAVNPVPSIYYYQGEYD